MNISNQFADTVSFILRNQEENLQKQTSSFQLKLQETSAGGAETVADLSTKVSKLQSQIDSIEKGEDGSQKLALLVKEVKQELVAVKEVIEQRLGEAKAYTDQQVNRVRSEDLQSTLPLPANNFIQTVSAIEEKLSALESTLKSSFVDNANFNALDDSVAKLQTSFHEYLRDRENFNTVQKELSATQERVAELTTDIRSLDRTLVSIVEEKYGPMAEALAALRHDLTELEGSFSTTSSRLTEGLTALDVSQGAALAVISNELGGIKANFSSSLAQLNEAVQASSMDFDESLEQLDNRQNSNAEQMRSWIAQSFFNSSMKVQALNDRLAELSAQLQASTTSNLAERKALEAQLASYKTEVGHVFNQMRVEYSEKIDASLVALNSSISSALTVSEVRAQSALVEASSQVKAELLAKIGAMEAATEEKLSAVERAAQSGLSSLRISTESDTKLIEGKVDFKVAGLQRDVKRLKEELEEKVGELDATLEQRIESTFDRRSVKKQIEIALLAVWISFRRVVEKVLPKPLTNAVKGVHGQIGRGLLAIAGKLGWKRGSASGNINRHKEAK